MTAARRKPSPYPDDAALAAALRAGDDEAFVWLVDRYDASLRRLARTYVSTDAVADEVVGETWLAVVKGIDGFEGRSSVSTWLYRILANVARSRGVREQRTIPFSSAAGAMEEDGPAVAPERFQRSGPGAGMWSAPPTPWDDEPEERLTALETLSVIEAAIDTLPPAQREVITMRDVDGWSADEVCNALGVTETNQRVLLHRARAKVRRALEQHFAKVDG
jgi:RNA polymerase sigma-70 factor (ECF subfamily)